MGVNFLAAIIKRLFSQDRIQHCCVYIEITSQQATKLWHRKYCQINCVARKIARNLLLLAQKILPEKLHCQKFVVVGRENIARKIALPEAENDPEITYIGRAIT